MAIEAWFKEIIRDGVSTRLKSNGGMLDGTMKTGNNVAGVVKFARAGGRIVMYKLSGSIEEVRPQGLDIDVVQLQAEDYTAEATIRNEDSLRQTPSYQAEVSDAMAKSVRMKRDGLKFDALNAFCSVSAVVPGGGPSQPKTIGDGSARIDLPYVNRAAAQIRGAGGTEEIYWPIPFMWFEQLCWYKEFSSKDYLGDKDLPFAQAGVVDKKTWKGVHIMALPDEHFTYGTAKWVEGQEEWGAGYLDTYMWTKSAVGCETFWSKEQMDMNEWIGKAGKPILCDTALSGAAIGLLPEGVKRMRFLAINDLVRPA
ncbi:hypothetical protein ACO34A_13125 [Rhizobium sp. ACO-34A]|nr:phage capsid protein [Rhizobium sp. ACO-34A]ATN34742.1 hypothetical protein ACO34A_13125 [Rhizobium sp. ACO-34A]